MRGEREMRGERGIRFFFWGVNKKGETTETGVIGETIEKEMKAVRWVWDVSDK